MSLPSSEVKQIAAQLLAGMLANPHIYHVYPTVSKTLGRGQQEEELIAAAIAMAETLITTIETQEENNTSQESPVRIQ